MKRVLSLVLVMCMAFSCLALSACVWEGIFGTTTTSTIPTSSTTQATTKPTDSTTATTTTTTTTTIINPDNNEPEDLVIQHGDNFTEEDIEFVKSLQGKLTTEASSSAYMGFESLFNCKSGLTPFVGHIDINSAIIICAYIDTDVEENVNSYFKNELDVEDYKWYKFDTSQQIPSTIDNDELIWSYLLFDAWIEKNALTNEELYYSFTYYMEIKTNVVPEYLKQFETMIAYAGYYDKNIDIDKYSFQNIYFGLFRPSYTDDNGKSYLIFHEFIIDKDGTVVDGYAKEELQEYYDILKPYFVELVELDTQQNNMDDLVSYRYVGVDFDTLSKLSLVFHGE